MTLPTVQYSATVYTANYNSGSVTVNVTKKGSGAGKVGLNTHAGSALSGEDFTAVNEWLEWAANDVSARAVEIPLRNRGAFKGVRSFTVGLSGQSGLVVGSPANAIVDINGTVAIAPPPQGESA